MNELSPATIDRLIHALGRNLHFHFGIEPDGRVDLFVSQEAPHDLVVSRVLAQKK
jgi:hypothetical protein